MSSSGADSRRLTLPWRRHSLDLPASSAVVLATSGAAVAAGVAEERGGVAEDGVAVDKVVLLVLERERRIVLFCEFVSSARKNDAIR